MHVDYHWFPNSTAVFKYVETTWNVFQEPISLFGGSPKMLQKCNFKCCMNSSTGSKWGLCNSLKIGLQTPPPKAPVKGYLEMPGTEPGSLCKGNRCLCLYSCPCLHSEHSCICLVHQEKGRLEVWILMEKCTFCVCTCACVF